MDSFWGELPFASIRPERNNLSYEFSAACLTYATSTSSARVPSKKWRLDQSRTQETSSNA